MVYDKYMCVKGIKSCILVQNIEGQKEFTLNRQYRWGEINQIFLLRGSQNKMSS